MTYTNIRPVFSCSMALYSCPVYWDQYARVLSIVIST